MGKIHISILGDIVPTDDNSDIFANGDADKLFTNVIQYFEKSDLVICNLESPLTDCREKANKSGPHLSANIKCVNALKNAGISIAGLANNHSRDYGDKGIIDTIEACKKSGISPIGAGSNIEEAKSPVFYTFDEYVVGVLAVCDNECSSTDGNRWGSYGYDDLETMDWICQCKQRCDYLIVLYHSGLEHYQYPSPLLQKRCRKMIEKGADFVTCQHSHCIGAQEHYLHGQILYGQGNTLFYRRGKDEKWNTGLLIQIIIENDTVKIDYIPIEMINGSVTLANKARSESILQKFLKRSEDILSIDKTTQKWKEWNHERISLYYGILRGYGRYRSRINLLLNNRIARLFIPNNKATTIANVIRCESHRESILAVLKEVVEQSKED